jgi:hypothetical protein
LRFMALFWSHLAFWLATFPGPFFLAFRGHRVGFGRPCGLGQAVGIRPGFPEGAGLGGHEDEHEDKGESKGDRGRNESGVCGESKADGLGHVGVLGLEIDGANGMPATGSNG